MEGVPSPFPGTFLACAAAISTALPQPRRREPAMRLQALAVVDLGRDPAVGVAGDLRGIVVHRATEIGRAHI